MAVTPSVHSFPLERPRLRGRYRETLADALLLPYFILGAENQLVGHLCQSQASMFQLANPLLLLGPLGSGKTAIALHVATREALRIGSLDNFPVRYLPAVDFARGFAESVDSDDLQEFQTEIDDTAILILDDLQLIAEKPAAQEELASRIEARCQLERPTIVTCRRVPSEVRGLRPRLVSRCLPGLTVPVQPPTGEARLTILRELSLKHSVELDQASLEAMDRQLAENLGVRGLDAGMKQLALWCAMNSQPANPQSIGSAIASARNEDPHAISGIAQAVARIMGLKTADLRSKSRKKSIMRARSLSMYLARKLTSRSLNHIGEYFGGRDHSTVLHAIRKIESAMGADPELDQITRDVKERLGIC